MTTLHPDDWTRRDRRVLQRYWEERYEAAPDLRLRSTLEIERDAPGSSAGGQGLFSVRSALRDASEADRSRSVHDPDHPVHTAFEAARKERLDEWRHAQPEDKVRLKHLMATEEAGHAAWTQRQAAQEMPGGRAKVEALAQSRRAERAYGEAFGALLDYDRAHGHPAADRTRDLKEPLSTPEHKAWLERGTRRLGEQERGLLLDRGYELDAGRTAAPARQRDAVAGQPWWLDDVNARRLEQERRPQPVAAPAVPAHPGVSTTDLTGMVQRLEARRARQPGAVRRGAVATPSPEKAPAERERLAQELSDVRAGNRERAQELAGERVRQERLQALSVVAHRVQLQERQDARYARPEASETATPEGARSPALRERLDRYARTLGENREREAPDLAERARFARSTGSPAVATERGAVVPLRSVPEGPGSERAGTQETPGAPQGQPMAAVYARSRQLRPAEGPGNVGQSPGPGMARDGVSGPQSGQVAALRPQGPGTAVPRLPRVAIGRNGPEID